MAEKKYYWLKLKRDFFKRHDIRIIESMPNGKDYILFYLKLLLESIDHEGKLRFNDTIPYNEQMLSVITNTNIDIVKSAMEMFKELNMVEIYNDQTIYMAEVEKLIGSETKWAEKKRVQRAKEDNVPLLSKKCPTEIELYKEQEYKNKSIKKKNSKEKFVPPTYEEVKAYCESRGNKVDARRFYDYFNVSEWIDSNGKAVKNWKQKVITWESNSNQNHKIGANGIEISTEKSELEGVF